MLYGLILFLHIVVSVVLVVSVLLQSSKGGGLSGTFGGSGTSGGIFGGRGAAPFLVKVTTTCAIMFMLTSITLNFVGKSTTTESALERIGAAPGVMTSQPAVSTEMPVATEPAAETQDAATTEDAEK